MMWMRWLPIDGVGGGGQDNNMLTASIPSIVIRLYLIESSAIITASPASPASPASSASSASAASAASAGNKIAENQQGGSR